MRAGGDCLQFFTNIFILKKIRHLPHYVVNLFTRLHRPKHTQTNSIHRRLQTMTNGKWLIGCEESGRVRDALRAVGVDAWSCDLLPCTENPSKYHIQDDLLKVIKSEKWDMIIAFPPCTHLAISGAKYFEEKRKSGVQQEAIKFVESIWETDCKVAIENPVGILSTQSKLGKATQYVCPTWFGETYRKKTGLWLKGFPKLVPTNKIDISTLTKKQLNKLYYLAPSPTRALERSKTPHGLAQAISQQRKEVV